MAVIGSEGRAEGLPVSIQLILPIHFVHLFGVRVRLEPHSSWPPKRCICQQVLIALLPCPPHSWLQMFLL